MSDSLTPVFVGLGVAAAAAVAVATNADLKLIQAYTSLRNKSLEDSSDSRERRSCGGRRLKSAAAPPTPVPSGEAESAETVYTTPSVNAKKEKPSPQNIDKTSNEHILKLLGRKDLAAYNLERDLGDCDRAVDIRRQHLEGLMDTELDDLPHKNYKYSNVFGACCENVIGYVPVPVGYAGPLSVNGKEQFVPMATTEGCLVASTNRGCRVLQKSGGVKSFVTEDGMTRAPCIAMPSVEAAIELKHWLEIGRNYDAITAAFNGTSRFCRLREITVHHGGRIVYLRFKASTGDAMGMNMVSKGVSAALKVICEEFPEADVTSLSGNLCVDKKPSAINWIEGRGKSVIAEAMVPRKVVEEVLKCTVDDMVALHTQKNLVGSALAGSIGGNNAHAANIVTAIYIATGQDVAQTVESSNCMTLFEKDRLTGDMHVSCTMPCLEVGTIGGGTHLPGQAACLDMLGVRGPNKDLPGDNAATLARVVCATVLAGELSLMGALAAGHLVESHMRLNRRQQSQGVISPKLTCVSL
eukprot:GFYU01000078.1.p1 GENE.GFYU01000078.1~~GFYU01000078.1.p1  ORF type:complete len:525 (+),score=102.93 GFYU01000078.1:282-1856(+)